MSPVGLNHRMSQKHEADLAGWFGVRVNPGSGNQSNRPMDGRVSHLDFAVAFSWDCKATRSRSISVSLDMWYKAIEQAYPERPMLALRFYGDDRLRHIEADLAVLRIGDLRELHEAQQRLSQVRALIVDVLEGRREYPDVVCDDSGGYRMARDLKAILDS